MKIGYLIGACGLAVTGAVSAHAASPAPGTPEFRQMVDESKALVREGRREMRTLTHLNAVEDRIPYSASTKVSNTRGHTAVPHAWDVLIDADDIVLDFEDAVYQVTTLNPGAAHPTLPPPATTGPFISLSGVIDPLGESWFLAGSAAVYTGIVDNAAAQTGPRWDPDGFDNNPATEGQLQGDPDQHGEIGGPDRAGAHNDAAFGANPAVADVAGLMGKFVAGAAGTIATQPFSGGSRLEGWLTTKFFAPTASTPVITMIDMYHDRVDSGMWYSPLSETEGNFFVVSSFWFGYTFSGFSVLADADFVIRRPLVLGPKPGSPNTGQFFVHPGSSPWRAKTDEWFTVGMRQAADSYSIWVMDSSTIGVNGFTQFTSASVDTDGLIYDGLNGASDPGDTQGAFAGEVFETDWLQIIPGVVDDVDTAVVEGYGIAHNDFFQDYVVLIDGSGSPGGPTFNSVGIDALHFRGGFDPTSGNVPDFTPNDHYIDNFVIMGDRFPLPDPRPDITIPFLDDLELWTPGALSIQGDDWFVTLLQNPSIVANQNNSTAAGATQAIRQVAVFRDNVYQSSFARRGLPPVTGKPAVAARVQSSIKVSDTFLSRGYVALDNVDNDAQFSHLIFGGRDASFLVDDFIYLRQQNNTGVLAFDPAVPQVDQSGANVIDNGTDNVPFVNVRLTDAGATPLTVPSGAWFEARVEVLFDAGGDHPLTPSFDFGAGFVTGVADTSAAAGANPRGITVLKSSTPTTNRQEWWTGGEITGFLTTIFVDDIIVSGPRAPKQYVQEVEGAAPGYASDPVTLSGWSIPYSDDMSSYTVGEVVDDHGWSPFLQTVFSDNGGEVDIIDVLSAPVSGVTNVYTYTMAGPEIITTFPGGPYTGGETVAVVDNLPPFFDPTTPPVAPGSSFQSRVNHRDGFRLRTSAADWALVGGPAPWNGTDTVVGRFQFQYDARLQAVDTQNLAIADPTGAPVFAPAVGPVINPTHDGTIIALGSAASGDAVTGDTDFVFSSRLPEARARGGSEAVLSYSLWLGDGVSATNVGRTVINLMSMGAVRTSMAQLSLGGPDNFEDLFTFDFAATFDHDSNPATPNIPNPAFGDISPGPDGFADTFQFNDFQSTTANVYVRAGNPFLGSTEDFVWIDTGDAAPTNTWVTVTARVNFSGDWNISIDDGVNPALVYSGASLTTVVGAGADVQGIDTLQIDFGNDEGSNGSPFLAPLEFYSLGQSAPPEGGFDILNNPAGPGSFNDTLKYFYYETNNILPPAKNMPQITNVFVGDGSIVGARDLGPDDQLVFWNSHATASELGAATPLNATRTPRQSRFNFLNSAALDGDPNNPSDILARGFILPLGLPGAAGVNNSAPKGGIVANAPPYNNAIPFEDLLMSTLVGYAPPATTQIDRHVTYIDNISLDVNASCLADLTGDGAVGGADLGLLLGNWDFPGVTDLNGDGNTDGADLGLLLGAWGPGPC